MLAWELVADTTVASATTTVNFTGLSISKDDEYMLMIDSVKAQVGSAFMCVNNNTTLTQYYTQWLAAGNSSVTSGRANDCFYSYVPNTTYKALIILKLKVSNSGYYCFQTSQLVNYNGIPTELALGAGSSTFTIGSITSLNIFTAASNGIAAGSRFQLYKLVADKVADITVGTATTSVDITGLNITKDSEYLLVSDFNVTATAPTFRLLINNNATATNYYSQSLSADGTSLGGSRSNDAWITWGDNSKTTIANTTIKLLNTGYCAFSTESSIKIGSGIIINRRDATTTFTASSVSQITIVSTGTNGIGIGSRFQLYKMK